MNNLYIDKNIKVFLNSTQYIEIKQKYNVKLIYISGSRIADLQEAKSDYDITIIKDDNNKIEYIQNIIIDGIKLHFYIWDIKEIPYTDPEFCLAGIELNWLDESKVIERSDKEFYNNFKNNINNIIKPCCKKFGYTWQIINRDLIKQYNLDKTLARIGKNNYYILLCYYAINQVKFNEEERQKILKIKSMRRDTIVEQDLIDWFIEKVIYVNNWYESLDKNV